MSRSGGRWWRFAGWRLSGSPALVSIPAVFSAAFLGNIHALWHDLNIHILCTCCAHVSWLLALVAGASAGGVVLQAIECQSYEALCRAVRLRMAEIGITHDLLDHLSGVQVGYSAKIIGPTPCKHFGPVSWSILEALGLKVIIEVDPEAVERMRDRWVPRQVPLRTSNGAAAAGDPAYLG